MHIENKLSGEIKFDVFEAGSVRIVTLIRKLCLAGNLIFVYSFSILCLCYLCYVDVYYSDLNIVIYWPVFDALSCMLLIGLCYICNIVYVLCCIALCIVLYCVVLFCIVLYSYMHCIALYCYINSNYYLSPGDRMTIFRCSRNSSSNLRTSIVKHRSIVIHIKNINPHYRLPLPGTPAPFPLDVERVEEQRHLLGGLVGGGLRRLWVLRSTKQRMNWKRCNFSKLFKTNLFFIVRKTATWDSRVTD